MVKTCLKATKTIIPHSLKRNSILNSNLAQTLEMLATLVYIGELQDSQNFTVRLQPEKEANKTEKELLAKKCLEKFHKSTSLLFVLFPW